LFGLLDPSSACHDPRTGEILDEALFEPMIEDEGLLANMLADDLRVVEDVSLL
jgi:hypothetical protein